MRALGSTFGVGAVAGLFLCLPGPGAWAATPIITAQPAALTVVAGKSAAFAVTATGTATLKYQWRKNGMAIGGATARTYSIAATTAAHAGTYSVVVSNTSGKATSLGAALQVLAPAPAPVITAQPQGRSVVVPDRATFTVAATGSNLSYQWKKNDVVLPGATLAAYTTPDTHLGEPSASYSVAVSNAQGSVTSAPALLSAAQPSPVYAGDPVTLPSRPIPVWEYATTYSSLGAFRLGYDEVQMVPLWSADCSYRIATPLAFDSARTFKVEPRSAAAVKTEDYTGTGYSRGHMAMLSEMGYRYGTAAASASCYMTNISPQLQENNGGIWNELENLATGAWNGTAWTQPGLVGSAGRLWITTGPVMEPGMATIGPKTIPLPRAFYKVMVKEVNGQPQALAVVLPHEPVPPTGDLAKYVTSVQRVEELTGLNLFPSLDPAVPASFRSKVDVRGWGAPFESVGSPVNVHMVEPSWDRVVAPGASLSFRGDATSSGGSIVASHWNFGDGTTATTATASHSYAAGGTYVVTYTATDGQAASSSISRTLTVAGPAGNAAPVVGAVASQALAAGGAVTVAFTVSDDATPAGSLTVSAACSSATLLAAPLVVSNTGGACSLPLRAMAGEAGSATLTLTVTDGAGAISLRTFTVTVAGSGGPTGPVVLISQYYEGLSNNKWIEVTNTGTETASLSGLYLAAFNNRTDLNLDGVAPTAALALTGTLAPGASRLYRNSAATAPAYALSLSPVANTVCAFNGDDVVVLSTGSGSATWGSRTDVVGTAGTWGTDCSLVRSAAVTAPRTLFLASEWIQKTLAEVDNAAAGTAARLGVR